LSTFPRHDHGLVLSGLLLLLAVVLMSPPAGATLGEAGEETEALPVTWQQSEESTSETNSGADLPPGLLPLHFPLQRVGAAAAVGYSPAQSLCCSLTSCSTRAPPLV